MAQNVQTCQIDESVVERLKKFKLRKEKNNAAIFLKINKEKMLIELEEEYEDCTIEDLQNELPASQPRYIVLSYVYNHDDGRVSYPYCLIFCSPQGCSPELQMMYATSKTALVASAQTTKVFDIRSPEELTEEFVIEKLKFFR